MWGDFQYAHFVAQSYASIGEVDEGMRWLTRSVERGFTHYPFISERDPLLANLRTSPKFKDLTERTKQEWMTLKSLV